MSAFNLSSVSAALPSTQTPPTTEDDCEQGIPHRYVRAPVGSLVCHVCRQGPPSGKKLKYCSSCGERMYCGEACQKQEWKIHKESCISTDFISLETFYPFLAFLAAVCHTSRHKPQHFAIGHKITNNINPEAPPIAPHGGTPSKLVIVDDTKTVDPRQPGSFELNWCPQARSEAIVAKLSKRIVYQGYTLPVLMSVCLALLAEMYTTTSATDRSERRTRLRYKSSPIVDFGIAKGAARVSPENTLSYMRKSTKEYIRGQDPNDHYWLYFTTVGGEMLEMDFGMFTFNMCTMVGTEDYAPKDGTPYPPAVPVFFRGREFRKNAPSLHERVYKRFSILQSSDMHLAIKHSLDGVIPEDGDFIYEYMDTIADRKTTLEEQNMTGGNTALLYDLLGRCLKTKAWEKYPKEPPLAISQDPGQLDELFSHGLPELRTSSKQRGKRRH